MKIVVAGELTSGGLACSLLPGMRTYAETIAVDLYGGTSDTIDNRSVRVRAARVIARRAASERLVEAVRDHRPDWLLLIKGRGINDAIDQVRAIGTKVACYYPDNPFWGVGDRDAIDRLQRCDLVVAWSQRVAHELEMHGVRTAVVPFGYDDRWFPLGDVGAERTGIVFLGTWSARRERFLAALDGLELTVCGSDWDRSRTVRGAPPAYEREAGELLRSAAIGINLLHPQCAGAHNMRTREIAASGAVQLCDPGTDGSGLIDGVDCLWFANPSDLRARVESLLENRERRIALATAAQQRVATEHYRARSVQIIDALEAA